MILNKYCSVGIGLQIIKTGNIDLQIPRYFNDPYDCLHQNFKIKFSYEDVKHLSDKISAKFRPSEQELKTAIKNHNDIFDISYFYSMSCFSEKNDSMLMWSHYARNHSGICLEFEFVDELISNTKQIDYVDENFDLKNLTPEKAILIKHKDWSYEKEWRYIRFSKRAATRYALSAINILIKSKIPADDLNNWENEKQDIWKEFLKDEKNYIDIKPSRIYLGCEFTNHQRMNENIEYDKNIPVYDQNKNLMDGVAPITHYKNVELLKIALEEKIPVYLMKKDPFKFKLEPLKLDTAALNKVISDIEKVKFITYKNTDVLKLSKVL